LIRCSPAYFPGCTSGFADLPFPPKQKQLNEHIR